MGPNIDDGAIARLSGAIGEWDRGATCLAALAVTTDATATGALAAAAHEVMAAAGLRDVLAVPGRLPFGPAQLRGMAAAPLLQAAAMVGGGFPSGSGSGSTAAAAAGSTAGAAAWAAQSDAALAAQGQASGSSAALFGRFVLPHFADFADRLAAPGARMLDVGTGIGALAVGFAQAFPQLRVTGIDVMPRVLAAAEAHVRASAVASRVQLRQQDVAELTNEGGYDLAWIPAPFVPEPALRAGVARVVAALRPGGLLMIGHGTFAGTELEIAITRFKTAMYGGTALDGPAAVELLAQHGLTCVQTVPTPPGAPAITAGRT